MSTYEKWTKEALIARVLELENKTKPHVPKSPAKELPTKRAKQMDFSKYTTRPVAIRFAYLGWNYHGLAVQKDPKTPTVEQKILNALYKTRCIPSENPLDCNFSRCGRTDRDVSAMAQVISLNLRSNLSLEEQRDPANDCRELDYLKILNSHLPADILAYEICLRPPEGFDARFSCKYRHYRYFFNARDLDVEKMNEAAQLLIGEHDFRNLCKVDASKQITNFKRTILQAEIVHSTGDLYFLSLRGTAFLWNQVRSIMAILFIIGQGLEPVDVLSRLLDVDATPRRPAYEIAWGVPLVLYDCGFEEMEWKKSAYITPEHVHNVYHEHWQKMVMAETMLQIVSPFSQPLPTGRLNVGEGINPRSKYVPLFQRQFLETPEVVNERWLRKQDEKQRDEKR